MKQDVSNSLQAFGSVVAYLLLGWVALHLAEMITGPNWIIVIAAGVFGVINLVVLGRGLWLRRASNPENPNNV